MVNTGVVNDPTPLVLSLQNLGAAMLTVCLCFLGCFLINNNKCFPPPAILPLLLTRLFCSIQGKSSSKWNYRQYYVIIKRIKELLTDLHICSWQ